MVKQRTRILAWITSLMMLVFLFEGLALYPAWADTKTDVWDGKADTSWYNKADKSFTLTTPQQLAGLATLVNTDADTFEGKTISLGADIYLNEDGSTAQEWTPIGQYVTGGAVTSGSNNTIVSHYFKGTFDGCGHYVRNLYVDNSNAKDDACENNGLFAMNYGVIENVGVTGEIKTYRCGGGIAGYNEGTVRSCYGGCNISANGGGGARGSGGVVGRNSGTVEYCWSDAVVYNAYRCAGGVVGNNNGRDVDKDTGATIAAGKITGCWFTGSVSSEGKTTKGSITAANDIENGAVIENSYFLKGSCKDGQGVGTYDTAETQEGTFEFGTDGKLTSDTGKAVVTELSALSKAVVQGVVPVTGSENYPMLSWQKAEDPIHTDDSSISVIAGEKTTPVSSADIAAMAGEETTKSFTGHNGTTEVKARFTAMTEILKKAGVEASQLDSSLVLEAADGFSAEITVDQLGALYVYSEDGHWRSAIDGSAGKLWVSNLTKITVTLKEASAISVIAGEKTTPVSYADIVAMAGAESTKSYTSKKGDVAVTAKYTALKDVLEKAGVDVSKLESPIVVEAADGFSVEFTIDELDSVFVFQEEDGTYRSAVDGSAGKSWVSNLAKITVNVKEESAISVIAGEKTTPVSYADIAAMAGAESTKSYTSKKGDVAVTAKFTALKDVLEKAGVDVSKLESPIVVEAADGFSVEFTIDQLDSVFMYQEEDGTYRSAVDGSAGKSWVSNLAIITVNVKGSDDDKDCPSKQFSDLDTSLWYHEAVDFVLNNELFNGTSATTFEPNTSMTRAMFVTVLSRMEGIDASQYSGSDFSDVEAGQWYSSAIQWASKNRIVEGTGQGKFDPNASVTREQMAVIMYRYANYKKLDTSNISADKFNTFTDKDLVSDWAKEAMTWATDKGLINGTGKGALEPQKTATRAEVAQLITNTSDKLK